MPNGLQRPQTKFQRCRIPHIWYCFDPRIGFNCFFPVKFWMLNDTWRDLHISDILSSRIRSWKPIRLLSLVLIVRWGFVLSINLICFSPMCFPPVLIVDEWYPHIWYCLRELDSGNQFVYCAVKLWRNLSLSFNVNILLQKTKTKYKLQFQIFYRSNGKYDFIVRMESSSMMRIQVVNVFACMCWLRCAVVCCIGQNSRRQIH